LLFCDNKICRYLRQGNSAFFGGAEGSKLQNYLDFVKVVELMKVKTHLTKEGIALIKNIKSGNE